MPLRNALNVPATHKRKVTMKRLYPYISLSLSHAHTRTQLVPVIFLILSIRMGRKSENRGEHRCDDPFLK